tara:strand:+ start:269 stop:463 length:195 start_codon:yes stop_codon:yes gene_type:complete
MKKIIKGQKFICVKKVRLFPDGKTGFIKGVTYVSEADGCITSENKNPLHSFTKKDFKKHFVKLK